MADEADRADELIEKQMQMVIGSYKKKHDMSPGCVECGVEIPEARQKATNGTTLCIVCAEKEEANKRLYR